MNKFPQITRLGEKGILVEFERKIDPETLEKILFYKKQIQKLEFKQKIEVINAYNSLLITYKHTIEEFYNIEIQLKDLFFRDNITKNRIPRLFHLPVCYDDEFGLDLELIADEKKLSRQEVIKLHTAPIYLLYFIGFLPGFPYLGGLDEKLHFPRKETPRKSIEKGSVGIGGNQTGIYPKSSPGGWQILGKTPVNLFNKMNDPPTPFSAGDRIKFSPISRTEYMQILNEIKAGNYHIKVEDYEG